MNVPNITSLLAQPRRLHTKIVNRLNYLYRLHMVKDPFFVAHRRWVRDRGDSTLRQAYDLTPSSVVLDIGGYQGDFAQAIYERHHCHIYVFEPVAEFDKMCRARFSENPKIKCLNYGLSSTDKESFISNDADASSTVRNNTQKSEKIFLKEMVSALRDLEIDEVDLLKINIEGGEYDVLPHLIEHDAIRKIRHLQIQFHDFIPGAEELRNKIRSQLSKTHEERWNYPFVWESWQRSR